MRTEIQPVRASEVDEVHLPKAPLVRVIAQVRFPTILAVRNPDVVASFQEALRATYPILNQELVHNISLGPGQAPNVHQGLIWRLADQDTAPKWRVSLGVDFVALETSAYENRQDFLQRLNAVLTAVEDVLKPSDARRLGLRYINRLTDEAAERIKELIQPEVLGIMQPSEDPSKKLGAAIIHKLTEAQFLFEEGRVQGRWGMLPANATYDPDALEPINKVSWVLDLDMFTQSTQPFASEGLLTTATLFARTLYWVFREMVKEDFLRYYGGKL